MNRVTFDVASMYQEARVQVDESSGSRLTTSGWNVRSSLCFAEELHLWDDLISRLLSSTDI
jgi:aminoglycoside/choline kinase family phosphotransferase